MSLNNMKSLLEANVPAIGAAVLVVVLGSVFIYIASLQKKYSQLPPGNVWIDHTYSLLFETKPGVTPYNVLRKLYIKYGGGRNGMFTTRLLGKPTVVVSGTDQIRQILMKDMVDVGPGMPAQFMRLIGHRATLNLTNKEEHKSIRLLWSRFLSPKALDENCLGTIAEVIEQHLTEWSARDRVELYHAFKAMSSQAMLQSVLHLRFTPAEAADLNRQMDTFAKGLWIAAPVDLPGFAFHNAMNARKKIFKYLERSLAECQADLAQAAADPSHAFHYTLFHAFLEYRTPTGAPMDRETLLDNGLGLFFGGADTIVSTMTTIVQFLHLRPDVMDRLRAEQREIVARRGEGIDAAALHDMAFAEAVVKETLRARTMGNSVMRAVWNDLQVGEYVIPAGAQLILSYELTHCGDRTCGVEGDADFRHCQITAEAFRPERWLDPATRPLEYMPFAQGPKMCVGQHFAMKQMILLVAIWARKFDFKLLDTSLEWEPFLTPKFKSLVPVKVTQRT